MAGQKHHATVGRSAEFHPQAVGEHVDVDVVAALVCEAARIDDDPGRLGPLGTAPERVGQNVPHHLVHRSNDILGLETHVTDLVRGLFIMVNSLSPGRVLDLAGVREAAGEGENGNSNNQQFSDVLLHKISLRQNHSCSTSEDGLAENNNFLRK